MSLIKKLIAWLIAVVIIGAVFPVVVYADTDGTEIQVTDQPDRLILQLGPLWAGVAFELKTDTGVYPSLIIVDTSGLLRMDLGGSKTYTLSCLASTATISNQEQAAEPQPIPPQPTEPGDNSGELKVSIAKTGIPAGHLVMLITGLTVATGSLIYMRYSKSRKKRYDYDDDYE